MDLITRPYEDGDADAVATHINALDVHFGGRPTLTATHFREWMAEIPDLERDTRVVVTAGGEIAAAVVVGAPSAGGVQAGISGAVALAWRGRGLGRELLAWQLDRIAQIHAATAPDVEWKLRVGAEENDAAAHRLYERVGFTPIRRWFFMEGPTAGVPEIAPPEGLRVETAESVDPRALYEADMEAFEDHFGFERRSFEEWTGHMVGSERFRPELSRIAYDGAEIAGFVLSFDEAEPDRMHVGIVGTRRPWRGRGAATYLMAEVLTAGAKADKNVASLGVDATNPTGAVAVYQRVGLSVLTSRMSYSKILPII